MKSLFKQPALVLTAILLAMLIILVAVAVVNTAPRRGVGEVIAIASTPTPTITIKIINHGTLQLISDKKQIQQFAIGDIVIYDLSENSIVLSTDDSLGG